MNTADKQPDSAIDKRRDARSGLNIEDQQSSLLLKSNSNIYKISRMRDVSISGVGIETKRDESLQPGMKIALEYSEQDFELTIDGTIVWCNPTTNDRCMMGVQFDPRNRQDNCLFFLALRKSLDEFDGTYIDA